MFNISAPCCSINQRNKTPINLLDTAWNGICITIKLECQKHCTYFCQTSSRNVKLCKKNTKKECLVFWFLCGCCRWQCHKPEMFFGSFFSVLTKKPITTKSVNHSFGLCRLRRMTKMSVNFDTTNDSIMINKHSSLEFLGEIFSFRP